MTTVESDSSKSPGHIWLAGCLAIGLILVCLYPDSYQQDGGHHFLFARWAWVHPELFVSVWQRPLFSLFHAVPALGGYAVSRIFCACISTVGAWFTWQTARTLGIQDSWRVIPFYVLQPALFLMWSDTMTEPLFGAVLAAALYFHFAGSRMFGAVLASLLIGARPEGAFVALVWGLMMLGSADFGKSFVRRGFASLVLATGLLAWILVAWAITGDPLFIKNNWPPDWVAGGAAYGRGPIWEYLIRLPEIAGPILMLPVVLGMACLVLQPKYRLIAALFLFTFVVHSVMRVFGLFGSAGYARYFSSFAPCLALAGAVGWNLGRAHWPLLSRRWVWPIVAGFSLLVNFWYVDGAAWNRDARAVYSVKAWYDKHAAAYPIQRFLWSQAAMAIAFDRDPWEKPVLSFQDREAALEVLRALPVGTLVCWDALTGKAMSNLEAKDFELAGFRLVHSEKHVLRGWFPDYALLGWGGVREQTMYLLYKDAGPVAGS